MDLENKNGLMALFIKVCFFKIQKTGKENLIGVMAPVIMDNLKIMIYKGTEHSFGEIKESIKDNGKIIWWMDMEFLLFQMAENIKETI